MIDAALLRPGRIDTSIYVPPPDVDSREQILKIHTKKMPLEKDVDLYDIAKKVFGIINHQQTNSFHKLIIFLFLDRTFYWSRY